MGAHFPVTLSDGSEGWYGVGPLSDLPDCQGLGIGSALMREGLLHLKGMGARGFCLVGPPDDYRRVGFQDAPGLVLDGVPQEVFLALAFDGRVPQGTVMFHEGFKADGQ